MDDVFVVRFVNDDDTVLIVSGDGPEERVHNLFPELGPVYSSQRCSHVIVSGGTLRLAPRETK